LELNANLSKTFRTEKLIVIISFCEQHQDTTKTETQVLSKGGNKLHIQVYGQQLTQVDSSYTWVEASALMEQKRTLTEG